MVLFADLHKPANDALSRDFPHETNWEVELRRSANNGETLSATAKSVDGDSVQAFASTKILGDLGHVDLKGSPSGAVVDLSWKPSKNLSFLPPKFLVNCRHDLALSGKASGASKTNFVADHQTGSFHVRGSYGVQTGLWTVSAMHIAQLDKTWGSARLGGEVSSAAAGLEWSAGVALFRSAWSAALRAEHGRKFLASVHSGGADSSLAAQLKVVDSKATLSIGVSKQLPSKHVVRCKLTHDALVAAAVSWPLAPGTTLTLGALADPLNFHKASFSKYGAKLSLTV